MSNLQSLADQLGWCISTKDFLNELNAEIRYVSNRYESTVEYLQQGGYMVEFLTDIQYMQQEFDESVGELMRYIESEHLDYIDEKSRGIQGMLEEAVRLRDR
jgi:hypothetical protein